ncbi:MAG: RelA/SpoT domain-containing protein [Lachnospiraceae bacterium]|nr:RelA/SpoT domain-containing protein [Lachnospiraceae bacterium]
MDDAIRQFLESYKKNFTFYENAARLAAGQLELALQSAGIRAIVISRAKNPGRLKNKLIHRNAQREVPYQTTEEIYEDIADLSGVRVSLYFPGDREKTDGLINDLFELLEKKQFPEQAKHPSYQKRFSGYWGNHYRALIGGEKLAENQKKYAGAKIEIQVASVLMHAWSEVEHDLIYKPLQGTLSDEEYVILDELNGLVMAGEIALERLQSAGNARIQDKSSSFGSQYDLASYLYNFLSSRFEKEDVELRMGNVELLFRFLRKLKLLKVKEIEPILRSVRFEKDRRNISQQIIDQIITGNAKRYQIYQRLLGDEESTDGELHQAIDAFFADWVPLEELLNQAGAKHSLKQPGAFNINTLKRMEILDKELANRIGILRKLRNVLVHEIEKPDAATILAQRQEILDVTKEVQQRLAQLADLNEKTVEK